MNQRTLYLVVGGLMACTLANAGLPDIPHRKAGLWDIKAEMEGMAHRPMPMQQCIDEKTDIAMQQKSMQSEQKNCETKSFTRTSNSWDFVVVCKRPEGTTTMHAVANGDFNTSYQVDMTIAMDPPRNGKSEIKNHMKYQYLGACGAGIQPGDMVVNGMKVSGMGSGQAMSKEEIMKRIELMRQQRGGK
jgi:hypothetical protein